MSEYPLILFPHHDNATRTKKKNYIKNNLHFPSVQRQWELLSPKFTQLQAELGANNILMQQTTAGIDPEQILVIETIGSIEGFAKAVKKIEGLEWNGESEIDCIISDEDFFDKSEPEKNLSGRLYFIMTNQRALSEMISLWTRYKDNPNMEFIRGLSKFKDVFKQIKDIRRWNASDRLNDTGILDAWKEDLKYEDDRFIKSEIELWFRGSSEKRDISEEQVKSLVEQLKGRIIGQSVIENIMYHALVVELPAKSVQSIIDEKTVKLVHCDAIMFFRPVGQIIVDRYAEEYVEINKIEKAPSPSGDPIIALLDGLPLVNNQFLANRLIIDDPDNCSHDYPSEARIHGTSMASLIIHGDLGGKQSPISRPIYVRPIMKPKFDNYNKCYSEYIPEDILVVDLIHRAVIRMFENNAENKPVAPKIKIINLSIGDPSRQFSQAMSPLARLIDWLSVKYNILFVVSAGNHSNPIYLDIAKNDFDSMDPKDREGIIVRALFNDIRNRALLSPAESINALTVGAVNCDNSIINNIGYRVDPYVSKLPSPYSAFGSGYRRAIKPDIVFTGGKQLFNCFPYNINKVQLTPSVSFSPPGNKIASPSKSKIGNLTTTAYSCGTSNATALISRAAGIFYDSLLQIINNHQLFNGIDINIYAASLLKAMIVHGSAWNDLGENVDNILKTSIDNKSKRKNFINRWIGYGMPEINRLLECNGQRATILGFGSLSDGEAHVFSLPLPTGLNLRKERRRLTVTLAWNSPISANTQIYRNARLWFELINNGFVSNRVNSDWNAVKRGTVQHEVFEGEKAYNIDNNNIIEIKVNCHKDVGEINTPILYGIVVSFEVSEAVDIDIYNQIKQGLSTPIQINLINFNKN